MVSDFRRCNKGRWDWIFLDDINKPLFYLEFYRIVAYLDTKSIAITANYTVVASLTIDSGSEAGMTI